MKEGSNFVEVPIFTLTPDNKSSVLQQIGQEREKKGNAEFLIPQIEDVQRQAENLGDSTTVMVLYQEKLLCAQHVVMENKKNPLKIAKGLAIMKSTTGQMTDYQQSNQDKIDPVVSARSSRFLGRQADLLHQYSQSEKYYRQGLSFFEQLERIDQRYQSLELSGFLAFSMLKQRKNGWFEITQQTLSNFDNSNEGIWLKDNDYYAWAVWKSGIEIRNSDTLLDSKKLTDQYRTNIENWLGDADSILQMPDGNREVFGIRRQELDTVIQRLD